MTEGGGAQEVPVELERALLRLVHTGGGQASWHWLATRLPLYEVPREPDLMTALKALAARGLLSRRVVGGGMDAWALTEAGQARLEALEAEPEGPLDRDQLAEVASALRGGVQAAVGALIPYADDGERMSAVLRQVLAADPGLAERVAFGAAMLPASHREAFVNELVTDPRSGVRAALFTAWAPARTDVPGQAVRALPERAWDALLRRGLTDADDQVRDAAAALVFASDRGQALVDELLACASGGARELRYWCVLGLGAARDVHSRALLEEVVGGDDVLLAAAAVRALAARPDGQDRWFAAITDLRPDVYQAAVFALAEVVDEVAPEYVSALERDGRTPVQAALAAYRARTGR